jgi:chaperone modulatory protein CbpM
LKAKSAVGSRRSAVRGAAVVRRRPAVGSRPVEIEVLAREAGLHPDLVLRFVRLGLLEPLPGQRQTALFPRDAAAQLARAARLRRDLGLNYAGAVLASELLARIDELEERLRRYEPMTNRSR